MRIEKKWEQERKEKEKENEGNNERIGMKEGNASEHEGRKKGGGEMKRKFVCKRNWGKKIGSS